jgi:uncharacterized protein
MAAADPALLAELQTLYAELDALYAHVSCAGSTECCRFGITGRQPFVTSIELALLQRAIARRGARAPDPRQRPLALYRERDEQPCPLLDRDARCGVYADRPFGCRTFFCERATGELPQRKRLRELLQRLKALAVRHQPSGDQGRPLVRALAPSRSTRSRDEE